jgi:hypothetical protein
VRYCFLAAGVASLNVENGNVIDPGAEGRYRPLLDQLSGPGSLVEADLSKPPLDAWFSGERLHHVVDARAEEPPRPFPVAARHEQYWWIFYQKDRFDHQLTRLMVVKGIPKDPPQ